MTKPLNELTACEMVRGIADGRFTAEAVTRACLDAIAGREDEIRAWAYLDPDLALANARRFDEAGRGGPLGGVPFGVKDIVDTEGMPTEWNSPIHRGRQAGRDAACVALSRKAGGLLLGKTVTTEFANRRVGPTRNPHNTERTPGGSSSGSAAAVAAMMVPLAIGTQTTGSTIRPSSFCGIVGYRPTYAEHRLHGVMEASGSLDTIGICARSVDDVALYRDVLLGIPHKPVARDGAPPRIGFCRSHIWPQVAPAMKSLVEDAADQLRRAGATVTDVELPEEFRQLSEAHRLISSFEFARTFTWEVEHHRDLIDPRILAGRVTEGGEEDFETYIACIKLAEALRIRMDGLWGDCDVLMTPGATDEAPAGWDAFAGADLYKMWTTLHVPAITLPVFRGPNDMPIGLQFFARRHADRALFAHAAWAYRVLS